MVHFGKATIHVENVNNAERNIVSMEQFDSNNIGKIVQLDDSMDNVENLAVNGAEQNVVIMEQRDTKRKILKNQRAIKRIIKEYGITRADLLHHSGKKLEEVATHFGRKFATFQYFKL